ncbi:MAG TPA: PGPGW domain-containing protein [Sporichthya sp.]|jgi:hypothetical protein|nr:PGPGW domain-containing protein [Sporichthya sp.]
MTGAAKRIGLEVAGWALLIIGVLAIPLPGPGLLGVFAGLLLLSSQYEWAEKRVEPVKMKALLGAAQGVESWPKIIASVIAAFLLAGAGVVWILGPDQPSWWPLPDLLWLPGGIWTGITQIASAIFALGFIVYSYRRYHGNDEEIQELKDRVEALSQKD